MRDPAGLGPTGQPGDWSCVTCFLPCPEVPYLGGPLPSELLPLVLVPLDGGPKVGQAFGFGQAAAGAAASGAEGPQGSTRGRPALFGLLLGDAD